MAWYTLGAAVVLGLYALTGCGIEIEWPLKANLPHVDGKARIAMACAALVAAIAAFGLYTVADDEAYMQDVNAKTTGNLSAEQTGVIDAELFAKAKGNTDKECYLANSAGGACRT